MRELKFYWLCFCLAFFATPNRRELTSVYSFQMAQKVNLQALQGKSNVAEEPKEDEEEEESTDDEESKGDVFAETPTDEQNEEGETRGGDDEEGSGEAMEVKELPELIEVTEESQKENEVPNPIDVESFV